MPSIALLGSGEFEPWVAPVDRWCIESSPHQGNKVLVAPTASAPEGEDVFQRWARMGVEHYRSLGADPVVLPLRTRDDAFEPSVIDALDDARLIFFSGGNPGFLAETLADTPFHEALVQAVKGGTALGGCSAGTVFLGVKAPFVSDDGSLARWVPGLSILEDAYIVPHFDMLDTYREGLRARLLDARPPATIVVGIDEHTALHGDGERWTVEGRGSVWIGEEDGELVPYASGARFERSLGLTLA